MTEYAKAQFILARKLDDGRTHRDYLLQVAPHSMGAMEELNRLEAPQLPHVAEPAWTAFLTISARRTSTGFGPSSLSWADIASWQQVTGDRLSARELAWVFDLDRLFLEDMAAVMKAKKS